MKPQKSSMELKCTSLSNKGLDVTVTVKCPKCKLINVNLLMENKEGVYLMCKYCNHTVLLVLVDADHFQRWIKLWTMENHNNVLEAR